MNKIREKYNKTVVPEMRKKFGYKNNLAVPKIVKIIVSSGTGSLKDESKKEAVEKSLSFITGQKPLVNRAKRSIASFNLRQGMPIGYSITLRKGRMYDFLEKLIGITFPRVKDFRGINYDAMDEMGNMSVGFREHTSFPEAAGEDVRSTFGLGVTIVTSAKSKDEAVEMLKGIGMPFSKK